MATLNLPVPPPVGDGTLVRAFTYAIVLDDVSFQFTLRWNARVNNWVIDVADAGGNPIVTQVALRLGTDLLAPHRGYPVPAGSLNVFDTSGEGAEATRDELGTRVLLQYVEAA